MEDAYERLVLDNLYADKRMGLQLVRGENLALLGELGGEEDSSPFIADSYRKVEWAELHARIRATQRVRAVDEDIFAE